MFEWMSSPEAWISLVTLTGLEIVLGIDNIIFIAILVGKLPPEQRGKGRILGLGFAMITRIILLFSLFWIMKLTKPLFNIGELSITGRDLVLIIGGLFLIVKSSIEIHANVTGKHEEAHESKSHPSFFATIIEIGILDIVFSLDSVITAVGVMMFASKAISEFVDNNPTIKMLALAFLVLVGFALVLDGFSVHVPKGYIYFAMGFSLAVECLNIYARKRALREQK